MLVDHQTFLVDKIKSADVFDIRTLVIKSNDS